MMKESSRFNDADSRGGGQSKNRTLGRCDLPIEAPARAALALSAERIPIPGTKRGVWPGSRNAGPVAADSEILLTAWLRPRHGGDLDAERALALGAQPPSQRRYADRKTLERQTAADPADVELLSRYCSDFGIRVADSDWRSVTVSGPIERLIEAFGATVAIFEDESERRFRHRSGALHVPPEIVAIVRGVFGLHQWPRSHKLGALARHTTPLQAADVAARYSFPEGDGGGQTIGVVALNGVFNAADFEASMRAQQVAPAQPFVRRVDDAVLKHTILTNKDLEAALDVQIIGALAPAARVAVYEGPNDERGFLDAVRTALFDDELAPSVLSISYGWPESLWTPVALSILDELFCVAALVGMSVFCSSGDNGAELDGAGTPHVVAPASSPFAVACGATIIADGGAERAWERTGGGFSSRFGVPPWQNAAPSLAAHYGVHGGRGVPDVAAQQAPGYYVVMDGTELAMGGTSAVAPVWAALAARINQRLGTPIGFFAPLLYRQSAEVLFTGVTVGDNGRFQAGPGWNPCTGLGVPIGTAIEKALRDC
jgi:kumamolisin